MDGMIAVYLTLWEIILRLKENLALTPARRRDLISAVMRMGEIVGVDLRTTPASLSYMRPLINKVRPAKHNLRPKTWSNLCSNFRAAVVCALPRSPRQPDPAWQRLRTALPSPSMKKGLSRLIGFCERQGIAPAAVCDTVLLQFMNYLENEAQVTNPRECFRRTCRLWNAAVDLVAGWPNVHVGMPNHRRARRTLPLSSYDDGKLPHQVMSLIAPRSGRDRFARTGSTKPVRASTARKIITEVELGCWALVEAGWDPASITLRTLLEPRAFETILRHYCQADKELTPRPTARNLASTLIGLARRMPDPDAVAPDNLTELRWLQGCLGPQAKRFAEKNRRLLLEFEDPEILERLLCLPERLAKWAARITPARGALAMELAVAIAILRHVPLRISNLAELRIRHELYHPGGRRSPWFIDIPPEQVKNRVPLFYELSERVTPVLERHISRFRPLRAETSNPYLFPVGAMHKDPHSLSQQIRRVIADWVGIDMTPHQFRHLTGFLWQKHRPGSFAAIAQHLGDKDIDTVIAHYAEFNTLSASREFDAILEAALGSMHPPRGRHP